MAEDNPDMSYGDTDPRYDNYPITEGDVERSDVEWVGFAANAYGGAQPRLYEPHNETAYAGEIDEENERVVLKPDTAQQVEEESLGEHIEAIGDEHGWEWLSEFAQKYLEEENDE